MTRQVAKYIGKMGELIYLKYVQVGLKSRSVKLLDWLGFFDATACFSEVPRTCTRTGRTLGIFLQDERHRTIIHTAVILTNRFHVAVRLFRCVKMW